MAFGRSPKIKGLIGLLKEQSAKPFGITFATDLRTPVKILDLRTVKTAFLHLVDLTMRKLQVCV